MNIFGQLIKASFEKVSSDLSDAFEGLFWYNTTSKAVKFKTDTAIKTVVDTDSVQALSNKETDVLTLSQQSTPGVNPAAGKVKLYIKNDKQLYTLNELGVESSVSAGGLTIPTQGTRQAGLAMSIGSQITALPSVQSQLAFVVGNGGPITISNSIPVSTAGLTVGQMMDIVGTSDSSTVTFQSGNSLYLNGDATLKKDSVLMLKYMGSDGTNSAWSEIGRNF